MGAWKTFVTFADRPPLAGMYIFISDGTLLRTTSDHPIRSPAHGVWEQTGDRDFAFSFEVLVFDEAGAFIETQKIWARVTVDESGDAYAGEAVSNYFDLAGALLRGTSPARSRGTPMVFEPMPAAAGTPEATPGA